VPQAERRPGPRLLRAQEHCRAAPVRRGLGGGPRQPCGVPHPVPARRLSGPVQHFGGQQGRFAAEPRVFAEEPDRAGEQPQAAHLGRCLPAVARGPPDHARPAAGRAGRPGSVRLPEIRPRTCATGRLARLVSTCSYRTSVSSHLCDLFCF
jgi:hypothetical protein